NMLNFFFFSSRRRHTRSKRDWSSDVCSSDLIHRFLILRVLYVRKTVFVDEQKVPEELEIDEFEETAIHFISYEQDEPIAASRLRSEERRVGKESRAEC